MQIYSILYEPKYNPKIELKALRETHKQQLSECFHRGIKSARRKRHRQKCDKITMHAMTYDVIIKLWFLSHFKILNIYGGCEPHVQCCFKFAKRCILSC